MSDFGHAHSPSDDGMFERAELFDAAEVIESQPLEQRAAEFDRLADMLLAELERSDNEHSR